MGRGGDKGGAGVRRQLGGVGDNKREKRGREEGIGFFLCREKRRRKKRIMGCGEKMQMK